MEYGGQTSKVKMLFLQQHAWQINEVKHTAKRVTYVAVKRKPLHKFHVIDGQNKHCHVFCQAFHSILVEVHTKLATNRCRAWVKQPGDQDCRIFLSPTKKYYLRLTLEYYFKILPALYLLSKFQLLGLRQQQPMTTYVGITMLNRQ